MKNLKYSIQKYPNLGDKKLGEYVYTARICDCKKVSFNELIHRTAQKSTAAPYDIEAVYLIALQEIKKILASGRAVQFGFMGTIYPTIKSKASDTEEEFDAQKNILGAEAKMKLNQEYVSFENVTLQRVDASKLKRKKKEEAESSSNATDQDGTSGTHSTDNTQGGETSHTEDGENGSAEGGEGTSVDETSV